MDLSMCVFGRLGATQQIVEVHVVLAASVIVLERSGTGGLKVR